MWQTRRMSKQIKKAVAILSAVAFFYGCGEPVVEQVVVSEKPEAAIVERNYVNQPSQLGLRLQVAYDDLVKVLETSIPGEQSDTGKKKVCKKVLGFKACSTVVWDYTLRRTGSVAVSADDHNADAVRMAFPFEFEGTAGIRGELAKALGLSSVDFDGAVDIATVSTLDIASDWCPQIQAQVDYKWIRQPRVEWAGGIDFNVRKLLDSELEKQLADIDKHLASAIDCERIREEVLANWQPRSLPLDLDLAALGDVASINDAIEETGDVVDKMYLNVTPLAASFSGVKTEKEALGFTLQLESLLSLDKDSIQQGENETPVAGNEQSIGETKLQTTQLANAGVLPTLETIPYEVGDTRFSLLVRAPYTMLAKLSMAALDDKTFNKQTAAGEVGVHINDVTVFPAGPRLGIGFKFDADLPGSRRAVPGEIFMTALPRIDDSGTVLSFEEFEVTKLLDSVLWNSLASLFKGRIVQSLENNAQIDLRDKFADLEIDLISQLANTERTRGARVRADDLRIHLQELFPENDALTLVLQATTKLDVELPFSVFEQAQVQ